MNAAERALLDSSRLELGLSLEEAEEIEASCVPPEVSTYKRFLEGVYVDGVINEQERRFLDDKKQELGISAELAMRIEEEYIKGLAHAQPTAWKQVSPHRGAG